MRVRAETLLIAAMGLFALTGWTAIHFMGKANHVEPPDLDPVLIDPVLVEPVHISETPLSARVWFDGVRGFCNPVDVVTRLRWQPAPGTEEGWMYEAACYALAGRVDLARTSIERVSPERRYHAAGVVFDAGHPAADAGDELAAGPLMELVVEFWPNHYMALYHAGAARFERGDHEVAGEYLRRFLVEYRAEDGWRRNALSMLEAIEG